MTGQLVGSIASVDDVPALFAADHMVIGSSTLANAGGSWECREVWASSVTAKVTPRDQICLGHGGYIGLTAYVHTLAGEDVWTMGVIGSIEKTP
jgi:hypothetical protein